MNNHGGQQNLLSTSEIFRFQFKITPLKKPHAESMLDVEQRLRLEPQPRKTCRSELAGGKSGMALVWSSLEVQLVKHPFEGLGPSVCHFVGAMGFCHSWDCFTIKWHSRTKSWGKTVDRMVLPCNKIGSNLKTGK